ncbi:unnamed protein product [Moneuplotes crassus]|uniref:Uncharacterized protein n=1 Tax=Euplotes crassus TaxID=5936 RepID=A0AAD1XP48_EUPCR|nr:unnamed protein product [Moneuplotes crassus]
MNNKLKLVIVFTVIVMLAQGLSREEFVEKANNVVGNLGQEVNLRQTFFNGIRTYWNGVVNGYNSWSKTYKIKDWCMNDQFQETIVSGIIIGLFRTLTLQYVNLFQLGRDINNAFDQVTGQLIYCKGDEIGKSARLFFFDTIIWFEIAAVITAVAQNFGMFIASIPLGIANLISGDLQNLGYIHGKLVRLIFDAARQFQ